MIQIKKEQMVLLELLKATLFQINPEIPSDNDWERVFEMARGHCIVSLLEPIIPQDYRSEWTNESCQRVSHFLKVIYEQGELVKLLKERNVPVVILKGTAAAMYYPEPARRTMGDIDFLVPVELYDDTKNYLEQNGYIFCEECYRHCEFVKNGIDFELHKQFSSDKFNDIEHILRRGMEHIQEYEINQLMFPGLPPCENGLILLGHMMYHIKISGLGLRQVIDWMMFVYNVLDDRTWEMDFKALASEAGLEKLAITITFMCKKWLGLPDRITWCNDADEELADLLMQRIIVDGNFGRQRSSGENASASIRKKGLFPYLQNAGIYHWPLAQKYKVFRLFAWLYQIFYCIGKGISSLFDGRNELNGIKESKDINEILKKLEL